MIDTTTEKPLRVSQPESARPYIRVAYSQLHEVQRILDQHRIRYTVRENIFTFDGGPEIAYVDLGRRSDGAAIQTILDDSR